VALSYYKPWSPWFNHFEIELTLVAGNDVKFVTVVQPMLLLWSLWFQDGGVSNFSGSAFLILAIAYFPLIICSKH
jgi:hypothetical protein